MLYSEPGTSCSSTCEISLPILRVRHTQARTVQTASCRGRQYDHGCADVGLLDGRRRARS
eukprot:2943351-Prymnesium_polylepis.1